MALLSRGEQWQIGQQVCFFSWLILQACDRLLLVVDRQAHVLTRLWCLWEVLQCPWQGAWDKLVVGVACGASPNVVFSECTDALRSTHLYLSSLLVQGQNK